MALQDENCDRQSEFAEMELACLFCNAPARLEGR